MNPRALLWAPLCTVLFLNPCPSQEAAEASAPPKIYDEQADAGQQIAAALAKARKENRRVLIQWGANWCGWCHKLHTLCKENPDISRELMYEYEVVLVDVGNFNKNLDVAQKFGAEIKAIPFLTVLAADGSVIKNQETGSLEEGPNHVPERVLGFLEEHESSPLDAEDVLAAGLARAASEDKTAFVHIGAPWCGWCHRLEDFMAQPEIAAILQKDFVDVKIDQDRMVHGAEVAARLRENRPGGIPWFTFMNGEGEQLSTSDAPQGNCGYPANAWEIAHFMEMLTKAGKRITAQERQQIMLALYANAIEIYSPAR